MTRLIDIKALVALLEARSRELIEHCLPGAVVVGQIAKIGAIDGTPSRHGSGGGSCVIWLRDASWRDYHTGEFGDALELIAQSRCGGNKAAAIGYAKAFLGLDGTDPAALRRTQQAAACRTAGPEQDRTEQADKSRRRAFALWLQGAPIAGTPVEWYLRARGIDLRSLGRQPRALRYHAGAPCTEMVDSGAPCISRDGEIWGYRWPAMLAAIGDAAGKIIAVHRTYLVVRPDGSVTKAPLRDPKRTLASFKGGCVRLWRGATGAAWKDMPQGEAVALSEGIENGLSVAVAMPELRVAAAVSAANMANVILPPQARTVILIADNDADPKARAQLDRAIAAHQRRGLAVRIARAPSGKDMNALLTA